MAPWPSGKAKVCNTSITSSNLVGAFGKNKPCACSFIMFAKTGEEKWASGENWEIEDSGFYQLRL